MAVTNYYTVNGRIRGESTGGVRTTYGTDALGSVTGTYDQNGNAQNAYLWAPYGTQIRKTGSASDPKFGWNGSSGYRSTSRNYSGFYARTRHFDSFSAQWSTADRVWPKEPPFAYVGGSPVLRRDPTGRRAYFFPRPPIPTTELAECVKCAAEYECPKGGPECENKACRTFLEKIKEGVWETAKDWLDDTTAHALQMEYCRACEGSCLASCCTFDTDCSDADDSQCSATCLSKSQACMAQDVGTFGEGDNGEGGSGKEGPG